MTVEELREATPTPEELLRVAVVMRAARASREEAEQHGPDAA